ncbi:unnamed protein product, partial [Mesorhabditis belari]|uniref:N-acetylgalactosaminide beta-1,3-galactosyltransferase n=1 Tax=Mesorhabditis belari TaxID=2138241 RepID=A0AAF3EJA0_9BILA
MSTRLVGNYIEDNRKEALKTLAQDFWVKSRDRCLLLWANRHDRQKSLRFFSFVVAVCLTLFALISIVNYGSDDGDRMTSFDEISITMTTRITQKTSMDAKGALSPREWNRSDAIDSLVENSESTKNQPLKGSLFCFVLTSDKHHARVPGVNETWLPRCDHGRFFTNSHIIFDQKRQDSIPYSTVFAGIEDRYENLFFKTIYALHYIYSHISKDFDWYFKADDDTYVVVENLRDFLSTVDPNQPFYAGFRMKPELEKGYNSGGAGYVLSRETLRRFETFLYRNQTLCPDDEFEDLGLGRCLANLGIFPVDSRNEKFQQRFNGYHYNDIFGGWITNKWIYDPQITGMHSIGSDLISLHHVSPNEMRIFDRLLYTVRPSTRFLNFGRKMPDPTILIPKYIHKETNQQTKVQI